MDKTDLIKVFISHREAKCDECGEDLGNKHGLLSKETKAAAAWHRLRKVTCFDTSRAGQSADRSGVLQGEASLLIGFSI
jgi:hypothetical protein